MLNVLLLDANFYYLSGLSSLIYQACASGGDDVCFLLPGDARSLSRADIIFRDNRVTVRVARNRRAGKNTGGTKRRERLTLHIPFMTKRDAVQDIALKIGKILAIAKADCRQILDREAACGHFGLKKYAQLSATEQDVMILIGLGYTPADISRILNRSQKTISTHSRNASRKMGASSRAAFWRYASFIASCGHDERHTLCL